MSKFRIFNKIKIIISIIIVIILCTSCNNYLTNKHQKNTLNNNKDNIKNYEHIANIPDAYIIDLTKANLSDKVFDNYYIELQAEKENMSYWFPNYYLGFDHVLYTVAYEPSDSAGSFPYVGLYSKNIKTGKEETIKEVSQTKIFDLCSISSYAYWYEQKIDDDNVRIIKMDLKNGETNEIISFQNNEKNNYEDNIKLSVTEEFLIIWNKPEDDKLQVNNNLLLYNHITNKFFELSYKDIVSKETGELIYTTAPHVDNNYLTFFSKNTRNELFVNRYDLKTKEKLAILVIGNIAPYIQQNIENTIYECPLVYMSSKDWICWVDQGSKRKIVLYNIENKKTYSINKDYSIDTINSVLLKDNMIYINVDAPKCKIFKVELDSDASEIGLKSNMKIQGFTSLTEGLDMYSSYFQIQEGGKVCLYSYSSSTKGYKDRKNLYMLE